MSTASLQRYFYHFLMGLYSSLGEQGWEGLPAPEEVALAMPELPQRAPAAGRGARRQRFVGETHN